MNDNLNEKDFEVNGNGTESEEKSIPNESTFEAAVRGMESSSENKPKKKKKGLFWKIAALCLAGALITASIGFGFYTAIKLIGGFLGGDSGTDTNVPSIGDIGGTNITVNMSDLDVNASEITKATYAAYDSSLLIQAYSDSNATSLASTGSGVLWTSDGYVVTCNHVVEGFSTIKVTFTDGSSYFVESMATDPATDLALLKITLPAGSVTHPVMARDTNRSALMLGETVIAIGNPLGYLTNTVTDGILSSLGRSINVDGTNMVLMQINAAVNSGNSGGGLFDINGSLIGIVNAKIADVDVEGIGFAIPIDTVINVVTQLADKGYVSGRPTIGIDYAHVTMSSYREAFSKFPDLSDYASAPSGRWGTTIYPGVYVVGVKSNIKYAPSSQDKLEFGDRIYQIATETGNYIPVENGDTIRSLLSSMKVGDTIRIVVVRDGNAVSVSVVLSENTSK